MGNETIIPVVSLSDLELKVGGNGEQFQSRLGRIGSLIGLKKLGMMLTIVEPGKKAYPFHAHAANDEAFIILEGGGTYRFGDHSYSVKEGDVVGAPAGGADVAHQIINTGSVTLKYIGISTKVEPEIVEYPDSGKFAAVARVKGDSFLSAEFLHIGRVTDTYDYWDGETE
ncbi:cupin domain-containing protein [uncultured Cohaesibacter sp.]|uniref:cupin domain-containing protein n=1 Tax=uncultured Cohaesibacter sp. TaxID=1002546 RepID=UPI0029C7A5BF|nr:cupin domain-containing protein [uncultured Cohaesibacter sp.]